VIDVVMEMREGRLEAHLVSNSQATRELLGESLPRLREALIQSGLNVNSLDVGSDSKQYESRGGERDPSAKLLASGQRAGEENDMGVEIVKEELDLGIGSIDFWA
jgi:Flagellar hook-length control protein